MIPANRKMLSLILCLIPLIILTACTERTPEEQIELKLENYRGLVLEYSDTMKQLRNNEITAVDADRMAGREAMDKIEQTEFCIRELVETHRETITDGIAEAFLSKLERYSKLINDSNPQGSVPKMAE